MTDEQNQKVRAIRTEVDSLIVRRESNALEVAIHLLELMDVLLNRDDD